MSKKKLKGKWALVTGSSRGIGQYIALGLANEGCNIIVHGRSADNCEETLELLKDYDVECFIAPGELLELDSVQQVIDTVFSKLKGIDILYNNAAVMSEANKIWDIPMTEWQRIIQVNLLSVVMLCNAFAPGMQERGFGRIINVSSGIKDQPDLAPYSVSKAAIDKFTRDLACELKDSNVLVNYLDPGWIKTDLGGQDAWFDLDTVLPGVLIPALLDEKGQTGHLFAAQDYKDMGY